VVSWLVGVDYLLRIKLTGWQSAAIAYIPAGFGYNLMLSSYARDKRWGMAEKVGYIPAILGGKKVHLATDELPFKNNDENMRRWKGWLNVIRVDSWIVFSLLTFITLIMTSVMAYALLTPEQAAKLRGFAVAAAQAQALANVLGAAAWVIVLLGVSGYCSTLNGGSWTPLQGLSWITSGLRAVKCVSGPVEMLEKFTTSSCTYCSRYLLS
jgi:hypothetical protein